MAKSLNVLFISSEVYPFIKESEIADVSFSLPLALRDIGHDVRVMMPKYGSISERKNRIHEINRLRDISIPIGKTTEPATVKSSSIYNPRVKVQAYITTNEKYFDSKKGIYNDPKTGEEYPDNAERFIFFNRSVIETCLILEWFPDIIHCNDWQTAIIAAYAKGMFPQKFKKTKIVFTIHDITNQGIFPISEFKHTGLSNSVLAHFKHKNKLNFLKGALHYADYVTTVSETYADEILNDKSNGLNAQLKSLGDRFIGILNGIDKWVWNPAKDGMIESKYDSDFEEYKYNNKVALLNQFGLEFHPKRPLIGMVSGLEESKGINLFIESADRIFENDLQIVMLGVGSAEITKKLNDIAAKYPEKFKVRYAFDDALTHLIYAGSDMTIIPPKIEPCGLSIMYSMLYGSIPIARATGGMKEVIEAYDPETGDGNTIAFDDFSSDSLMGGLNTALELFKNKPAWEEFALNGMSSEFNWLESVEKYDAIYRKIIKEL